jgi:hypothetical protein
MISTGFTPLLDDLYNSLLEKHGGFFGIHQKPNQMKDSAL